MWECRRCGRQTSVTAGTVLHKTRTDLRIWLYALWVFGVRHTSISALQLQRETGLRRYETAWTILHKVRAVLSEFQLRTACDSGIPSSVMRLRMFTPIIASLLCPSSDRERSRGPRICLNRYIPFSARACWCAPDSLRH